VHLITDAFTTNSQMRKQRSKASDLYSTHEKEQLTGVYQAASTKDNENLYPGSDLAGESPIC
jgi:hypothetical protein